MREGFKEVDWRLEMLVGHLSDQLAPARELVASLRLRANAGHTSRSELEHLCDLTGAFWQHLQIVRDESR